MVHKPSPDKLAVAQLGLGLNYIGNYKVYSTISHGNTIKEIFKSLLVPKNCILLIFRIGTMLIHTMLIMHIRIVDL